MNYLELAMQTRQECDASGTGPAAVTNQAGESKRIVDWVKDAWTEIQNRHQNWRWMRSRFTLNTVAGDDTYAYTDATDSKTAAAIARFNRWWWQNEDGMQMVRIYKSSEGVATERRLIAVPSYSYFKYIYRIGTQNNGVPAHVSVDEDDNLVIGPKPDGVYVVSGEFQRGPQILAANADIPDCPTKYHLLIVYHAMMKYGGFEAAQEVFSRARALAEPMMRDLEATQLPEITLAEPLA